MASQQANQYEMVSVVRGHHVYKSARAQFGYREKCSCCVAVKHCGGACSKSEFASNSYLFTWLVPIISAVFFKFSSFHLKESV